MKSHLLLLVGILGFLSQLTACSPAMRPPVAVVENKSAADARNVAEIKSAADAESVAEIKGAAGAGIVVEITGSAEVERVVEIKGAVEVGNVAEINYAVDAPGIYDHLLQISKAVETYREKHQEMPSLVRLVESGLFKIVPALGKELGSGGYDVSASFDNMDGQGEMDHAIFTTGPFLPAALCSEFNQRYASAPLNDGTIFDYQAAGNKYPGAVYGRKMKAFAIKWKTVEQGCEINWVLEYR